MEKDNMRTLINYIRSCFCKHEWELLQRCDVYEDALVDCNMPVYRKWVYRCKKCGCCKIIKSK